MDARLNRKVRWNYRMKGKISNITEIRESWNKNKGETFGFLKSQVILGKSSLNFSCLGKLDEIFLKEVNKQKEQNAE